MPGAIHENVYCHVLQMTVFQHPFVIQHTFALFLLLPGEHAKEVVKVMRSFAIGLIMKMHFCLWCSPVTAKATCH